MLRAMVPVWRGMDQATLDREYNARASVPDYEAEAAQYRDRSADARAALPMQGGLVFDPASGNALDWFPAAPGGPVLLWIHGGYWRALSRSDQSCVAPGLVAGGVHVAVMDYTLVPPADLDEIVRQVRAAAAWVHAHAAAHGADPARLFVGGSSAGGHLAGMLLAEAPVPILGAIPLSGLFDLEPVRLSFVNAWMRLDAAAAQRNSPLHHIPPGPAPRLLAAYGALETSEFRRQTEAYAAAWSAAGHEAQSLPVAGRNHFDLAVALGTPGDPLCRAALEFMS